MGTLPFYILIAEFLIPVETLFPSLNVAAKGEATAPRSPEPIPLKNPAVPSSLALLYGLVKIPVTPFISSEPHPFTPS